MIARTGASREAARAARAELVRVAARGRRAAGRVAIGRRRVRACLRGLPVPSSQGDPQPARLIPI